MEYRRPEPRTARIEEPGPAARIAEPHTAAAEDRVLPKTVTALRIAQQTALRIARALEQHTEAARQVPRLAVARRARPPAHTVRAQEHTAPQEARSSRVLR